MTYSVPDPASESPDRSPPARTPPRARLSSARMAPGLNSAHTPPLPTRPGAPTDDLARVGTAAGADEPLPRHAAPETPTLRRPTPPPEAQVDDGPRPGRPDGGCVRRRRGEPMRVAHEDSEDYEKFVTDPEAAEEATRARMDAQAEAEKAAAGITPAAEDS